MTNKHTIDVLKGLINTLRDTRKYTIKSDSLNDEQLYYLQEGYREGLCSAAMTIAEELSAELQDFPECPEEFDDNMLVEIEEEWWHTHNDEEGDIGSPERYK